MKGLKVLLREHGSHNQKSHGGGRGRGAAGGLSKVKNATASNAFNMIKKAKAHLTYVNIKYPKSKMVSIMNDSGVKSVDVRSNATGKRIGKLVKNSLGSFDFK